MEERRGRVKKGIGKIGQGEGLTPVDTLMFCTDIHMERGQQIGDAPEPGSGGGKTCAERKNKMAATAAVRQNSGGDASRFVDADEVMTIDGASSM